MVKLSASVSDSKADNVKSDVNAVYNDLLAHRDIVCLPQLRFGGTPLNEYAAVLIPSTVHHTSSPAHISWSNFCVSGC